MTDRNIQSFNEDLSRKKSGAEYRKRFAVDESKFKGARLPPDIQLSYQGRFSQEFVREVEKLIRNLIGFAVDLGLSLKAIKLKMIIFDYQTWQLKPLSRLKNPGTLPSLLEFPDKYPDTLFLIIDRGGSAEINMINLCRLIFAKLFGVRFFSILAEQKGFDFGPISATMKPEYDATEIASLLRNFTREDPEMKEMFRELGLRQNIPLSNAEKFGAKTFFRVLEGLEGGNEKIPALGKKKFEELNLKFREGEYPWNEATRCLTGLNSGIRILVGDNERLIGEAFAEKKSILFQALFKKCTYVISVFEQLKPFCTELIRNMTMAETAINPEEVDEQVAGENGEETFRNLLGVLRKNLLREKIAYPFFAPPATMERKEVYENAVRRGQFILGFLEGETEALTPENSKRLETLQKNHENCAGQKLYNLSLLLSRYLKSRDESILKSIRNEYHWLEYRIHFALDMKNLMSFFEKYFHFSSTPESELRRGKLITEIGQGWGYFIAYALIYEYYDFLSSNIGAGKYKKEKFETAVLRYIAENKKNVPFLRYAFLIESIHRALGKNLVRTVKILKEYCPSLYEAVFSGLISKNEPSDKYVTDLTARAVAWLEDFEESEKIARKRKHAEAMEQAEARSNSPRIDE